MSQKITKSFIDTTPFPDNGQVFYRDSELKGFGLRVGSNSKVYFAEGKIHRKTIRVSIGHHGIFTAEQARNEAKSILGLIARGVNPNDLEKAKKARSVTLLEVYQAYIRARSSLRPRTRYDYERVMQAQFPDWQNKPIVEISKDMIEHKHRALGLRSQAQANHAMRLLRALFNFALGQYEDSEGNPILRDNPTRRLSQTRAWFRVERRLTFIKPHDLPVWFQTVKNLPNLSQGANREAVRDYLFLLLMTGLRREEGLSLQWRNIDFRAKTLTIPDPKNRISHTLPLSTFLYDLLKRLSDENLEKSHFVFPGKGIKGYMDDPNKQMKLVIEASGVTFTPHDLRRTFITIAESLDIPAYSLKKLLNHKMNNDVTAGYIITDVERLRLPMQKITDYILRSVGEIENSNVIAFPSGQIN